MKEEDFAVLATNALKDACGFTNPIQATHEEIVAIYRAATIIIPTTAGKIVSRFFNYLCNPCP